ncbi:MAG: HAD family phosphatase [Bacteroidales bacterium]|nr:HAD family phosphatase [Bacteroidales bacterium]
MTLNLTGIRNLVFDFGGVIIDIDYDAVRKAFQALGLEDVSAFYQHDDHSKLVENFESGKVSENDFRDTIIQKIGGDISYERFDETWNAILKSVPPRRVELLTQLSHHFNLYLLSNTNIIHYRKYSHDFEHTYHRSLRGMFKKAYFSHEIKMRKPAPAIFQFVLNDAGITGEESLFVDDSELNIKSAESVGFKTLYKPQEEELTAFFENYL